MISCNLYDYIEIACMHRYPLKITMQNSEVIEGVALDTSLDSERNECIKIQQEDKIRLVVLQQITEMEVLKHNPHFSHVSFS